MTATAPTQPALATEQLAAVRALRAAAATSRQPRGHLLTAYADMLRDARRPLDVLRESLRAMGAPEMTDEAATALDALWHAAESAVVSQRPVEPADCPRCDGTGDRSYGRCYTCNGTGRAVRS